MGDRCIAEGASRPVAAAEVTRVYARDRADGSPVERLRRLRRLPDDWRNDFARKLEQLQRRSA